MFPEMEQVLTMLVSNLLDGRFKDDPALSLYGPWIPNADGLDSVVRTALGAIDENILSLQGQTVTVERQASPFIPHRLALCYQNVHF